MRLRIREGHGFQIISELSACLVNSVAVTLGEGMNGINEIFSGMLRVTSSLLDILWHIKSYF